MPPIWLRGGRGSVRYVRYVRLWRMSQSEIALRVIHVQILKNMQYHTYTKSAMPIHARFIRAHTHTVNPQPQTIWSPFNKRNKVQYTVGMSHLCASARNMRVTDARLVGVLSALVLRPPKNGHEGPCIISAVWLASAPSVYYTHRNAARPTTPPSFHPTPSTPSRMSHQRRRARCDAMRGFR